MIKLLTILFIFNSTLLFCQSNTLNNFFTQVRAGKYPAIPAEINKADNVIGFINVLPVYLKDSVAVVRSRAAALVHTIGTKSKVADVRAKAVQQLIIATRDTNSANMGEVLQYLTEFKKADFSKANKDSLYALLLRKPPHQEVLMKLIGYLEVQEASIELYGLSQDAAMGRKERWTAMLALTRMGDDQAAQDILNRVRRMPVGDAVVYDIFPDLVYTRNRNILLYLIETLNSDAKNCESADAEREAKIPCAYRVMEMLAPAIDGYPLTLDESGDVVATDYGQALQVARLWFKENKEFKIKKDRY